ncbi:hypothetical protein BC830DRAFT_1242440 [Chytriomyces sp. MP71]|nr:hypothetical protein BC830DRAFT_1242440 [Chytriomyces sp. MP71]
MATNSASAQLNVFGAPMAVCCTSPMTGYFRTGSCETDKNDRGLHTICVRITSAFLNHQKTRGNDLITPRPEFDFPGLKEGDRWCVCALRWKESFDAGVITKVLMQSTHLKTLEVVGMSVEELAQYAE